MTVSLPAAYAEPVRIERWGEERQLLAAAAIEPGAVLVAEYPIAFVEVQPHEEDDGALLLLESILATQDSEAHDRAADLKLGVWTLSRRETERLAHYAEVYRRNPKKLTQLYHRVAANNIRYAQGGVIGYGLWPIVSRSNHSCDPNARLGASEGQPLLELLIATRPIAPGTAICWNYLGDDSFLALDWCARNAQLLKDFRFLCRCSRCEAERPPEIAALPKAQIAAWFQRIG